MITEKAMLVAVHISAWTATKHDKDVSRKVADQHGAHENAGRYNKKLLQQAAKLDAIRTLAGQIRTHVYKITLPWSDEGYRILPASLYFQLAEQMKEFERQFYTAVDEFLAEYPAYIEQVRPALSGLFRPEDYPEPKKIREKFELRLEVKPIMTGEDFRVKLSEEHRARISREIDADLRKLLAKGTQELWLRLRKLVDHMVTRLQQPDGRLYASVVENIVDLINVLPDLNLTNDPALNAFVEEIRTRLCATSAKELKANDLLRTTTAQEAADIASRMAAHMEYGEVPGEVSTPPVESLLSGASDGAAEDIFSQMAAYMAVQ
jgi:hypothetical protein